MAEQIDLTPRPPLPVSLAEAPALRVIISKPVVLTSVRPTAQVMPIGAEVLPTLQILRALMGPSGEIEVVGVETLPAGSAAEVENIGTPQHARLIFRLPRGDAGEPPIFIGIPDPVPANPAIAFVPVTIGTETVYQMQVNVP